MIWINFLYESQKIEKLQAVSHGIERLQGLEGHSPTKSQ